MPATKRGIYHNLRESKYVVSNGEITFYFSSELYLTKFLDAYQENRKTFDKKMNSMLQETPFNMDTVADVCLYQQIEKRGFFARLMKAKITQKDLYHYAMRNMMAPTSLEWRRITFGKDTDQQTG
jgi:hypothetical protein